MSDIYDRFIDEAWQHMKALAVEPMFSMGELVWLLALLVDTLPNWLNGLALLSWIIWRNTRDSGRLPEGRDTK